MPTYEFECTSCHQVSPMTMSMRERAEGLPKCPKCGEEALKPLIGLVSIKTSRKS